MLAYVDHTTHEVADTFYPGYSKAMIDVGPGARMAADDARASMRSARLCRMVLTGQPLIHEFPGGLSANRK
jgi:hypothetical protein